MASASASASASARHRVDDSPPSRPSPKRGHFNEEDDEEDDNGAEASTPVASTISSVMPRAQRDSGAGSDGDSDVEDTTHSSSSVESKMLMKVLNRLANTLDGLAAKKRKNDKKKAPTMVLPTRAESQSRLLGHVAVMFWCCPFPKKVLSYRCHVCYSLYQATSGSILDSGQNSV